MKPHISASKNYTEKPNIDLFERHTHDNYEIFCFLSGNAKYFVEGNIYVLKPNDILIIKKSETHALLINTPDPYCRYVVNFNATALPESQRQILISTLDNKPLGKFNRVPTGEFEKNLWLHYLDCIVYADSFDIKQLYLTILLKELCQNISKTEDRSNLVTQDENLIEYINRNLMSISSLDEISEHFFISKTHLNRKFKSITGSTVWDYIVTKRLIIGKDMLASGWTPKTVSEKCGYLEYSAFYRAYKKQFGVSPKDDCIYEKWQI